MARLEHINLTVANARRTADVLVRALGWRIRWQGKTSVGDWDAVHVGDEDSYLALFSPEAVEGGPPEKYTRWGTLNHIGIVVDNLGEAENRVRAAGFTPHAHHDYEPGQRFYFEGPDGIEYEVVSYA